MVRRLAWALMLFTSFFGCAPAPTAVPTPATLRVVTTPALEEVVVGWVRAYREAGHAQPFELETLPFEAAFPALEAGAGEILLTSNEPPSDWFAASLREMPIAVIVHPGVAVRNVSLDQLRRIFSGAEETWEELGGGDLPIQTVVPPQGDELRRRFQQLVMRGAAVDSNAYLAPSPAVAAQLVAEHEGAVAFLPGPSAPDEVIIVRVEGRLPDAASNEGGYPLTLPVLAMSTQEPRGALRQWLIWVQNEGAHSKPLNGK